MTHAERNAALADLATVLTTPGDGAAGGGGDAAWRRGSGPGSATCRHERLAAPIGAMGVAGRRAAAAATPRSPA